jgi:hypothetical protein
VVTPRGEKLSQPESAAAVQRAYEFSLWLLPKVERFPRGFRFSLGDRCVNTMLTIQEALLDAAYGAQRAEALALAQRKLNTLRYLLRLAKDLQLLGVEPYGFAAERLEELGRMIGGWRKSAQGSRP